MIKETPKRKKRIYLKQRRKFSSRGHLLLLLSARQGNTIWGHLKQSILETKLSQNWVQEKELIVIHFDSYQKSCSSPKTLSQLFRNCICPCGKSQLRCQDYLSEFQLLPDLGLRSSPMHSSIWIFILFFSVCSWSVDGNYLIPHNQK